MKRNKSISFVYSSPILGKAISYAIYRQNVAEQSKGSDLHTLSELVLVKIVLVIKCLNHENIIADSWLMAPPKETARINPLTTRCQTIQIQSNRLDGAARRDSKALRPMAKRCHTIPIQMHHENWDVAKRCKKVQKDARISQSKYVLWYSNMPLQMRALAHLRSCP